MTTAKRQVTTSLVQQFKRVAARFYRDARGAVLLYITATLPALVGFALLAIDAGRVTSLHSSLQKGTDALALAAGGELDRRPGAVNRANIAVATLLENTPVFGNSKDIINISNITLKFMESIPADDNTPITSYLSTATAADVADTDVRARFVEVTVDDHTFNTVFPASFFGASNNAVANAVAVAGNDQVTCGLSPMFICNPWEGDNDTTNAFDPSGLEDAQDNHIKRRRLIAARLGPGKDSDWFAGNFGFLDMGNGAKDLAHALAEGQQDICFARQGVDTETGQMAGPVKAAMNTRFGLYNNPFFKNNGNNPADNPLWAPATNVRTGQTFTDHDNDPATDPVASCQEFEPDTPANAQGLPRTAACMTGNNNQSFTCRVEPEMTDTKWDDDVLDYWTANSFTGSAPAVADGVRTRWELFNFELDNAHVDDPAPNGETGEWRSACYSTGGGGAPNVNRRVIGIAVINCGAQGKLNGKEENIAVASFAEFFLTEAVSKDYDDDFFVELIQVVNQGTGIVIDNRDMVQLYR